MIPRATYRLQLNRDFTFVDAARLTPYLARLGISHIYASPILAARPGSPHGYDVIDPTRVNPELGGEESFRALAAEARRHGLGLIVDIVPNHMYAGAGNEWWLDVLRHGRASAYAKFFDIDWDAPGGKVLLPILGKPFGAALAAGEIAAEGDTIRCFGHALPVAPGTASATTLEELLERQHYRLAWWRTASDEINWRRFFDINDLVALRVEDADVFEATHATLLHLFGEGLIDGFRVDHVDGLADPGTYCRALRARLDALRPERAYLVVEKILGWDEGLPRGWETDGTTGYDFMNEASLLQHDPMGAAPLEKTWRNLTARPSFEVEERDARWEILARSFIAPLETLVAGLAGTAAQDPATRDYVAPALRRCLVALLSALRVYRTYPDASENNAAPFDRAREEAARHVFAGDREIMAWLGAYLRPPPPDAAGRRLQTRFQQLSAPLAAVSVEDTAFYRYGRLLSRNDVGFDPSQFARSSESFHAAMRARRRTFPLAMLATATHDHKRGEDVRARLAVLSEIPAEWAATIERCFLANASFRGMADDEPAPRPGDEAMLYQIIVGAWPFDLAAGDRDGRAAFAERVALWQRKSLREAKLVTDWTAPNLAYEEAAEKFVRRLFAEAGEGLPALADLARRIGPAGAVNGLVQTVLKLTVPGVPDFYQGTEFWDLSLVDPDNRRAVDYAVRERALDAKEPDAPNWRDGRVKQAIIARILAQRRAAPALFAAGDYEPIRATGPAADHIVAFRRGYGAAALLVVALRLPFPLLDTNNAIAVAAGRWRGTALDCANVADHAQFVDVLTGREIGWQAAMPVADLLDRLPVAVLIGR